MGRGEQGIVQETTTDSASATRSEATTGDFAQRGNTVLQNNQRGDNRGGDQASAATSDADSTSTADACQDAEQQRAGGTGDQALTQNGTTGAASTAVPSSTRTAPSTA